MLFLWTWNMILISSNLISSNSLFSNLHPEKGCFDTSYAAKSDNMTTVYVMSDYKLGLLGIPQDSMMVQARSVYGWNMVDFDRNHSNTDQGQVQQGMWRLNSRAVKTGASLTWARTYYISSSCISSVTSVKILRLKGKGIFKIRLDCNNELKLIHINIKCLSIVIIICRIAIF